MQAEVDPCRGTGRRHDRPVGDVQHARVELDTRVARLEVAGVHPVGRRATAVEEARGSEHERAGTDRHDPRAAAVRAAECSDQIVGRIDVGRAPAGHDDRVRPVERVEPERRLDHEAGLRADAAFAGGDDEELVPR
jgi:hypothetical protein